MPTKRDFAEVPQHAFFLDALGSVAFGDASKQQAAADTPVGSQPAKPCKILARTAQPIFHWYWGKIVHDLAGMQPVEKCILDWCHNYDETLGFLDKFSIDSEGLQCEGMIVPFLATDRASEILHKALAGVPWQASIDWSGAARIEELTEGMSAQVNGFQFDGPGFIVREWPLTAVAICPHGADPNTETRFAKTAKRHFPVTVFGVPTMSTETTPPPRSFTLEEINQWSAQFGAELGLKHLAEGTQWDAAIENQRAAQMADLQARVDGFASQLAAKDEAIAQLQKQLAAAKKLTEGSTPVESGAESTESKPTSFIRLPGRK